MDSTKNKKQIESEDKKRGHDHDRSQSKKNERNAAIPADSILAEKDEVKNAEERLRNKNKPSK